MKSEPSTYSILDLKREKKTLWEGVRNYQARNFMMQQMQIGDPVLFYHSNATGSDSQFNVTGISGLAKVSSKAQPDPTQFLRGSEYFDEKAKKETPTWFCVEIEFVQMFEHTLPLEVLRLDPTLEKMALLQRGQRLSVQPVTHEEFERILALTKKQSALSLEKR